MLGFSLNFGNDSVVEHFVFGSWVKTRTKSFAFKELKNQPMAELVWVGFFWGRQNPREHGRYSAAPKTCQKSRDFYDFAAPSLLNVDFEARFEPFLRVGFPTLRREGRGGRKWKSKMPIRINIDEGGGQNPSLMSQVLACHCRRDHENRSIPNKESIIFERSREKARQNRPKWEGVGKIL